MLSDEKLESVFNDALVDFKGGSGDSVAAALRAVAEAAVKDAGGGEVFGYVDSHPDHGHEFSKSKQALYPADIAEGWTQITVYERPQASQLNLDYLREMGRLEARIRELEQASASVPDLSACFMTAESGGGEYKIVVRFQTLSKMQDAHSAMVHWLAASQPEVKP